jgi:hypothetical protein
LGAHIEAEYPWLVERFRRHGRDRIHVTPGSSLR